VGVRNNYRRRAIRGAANFGAGLIGPVGQHVYNTMTRKRPVSQMSQGAAEDKDFQLPPLEYLTEDEINRLKYQRGYSRVRRPKGTGVVASLRSGRRAPLFNFRMKDVMDMIAPTCHFKNQRNMAHVQSTSPGQGLAFDDVLTVPDVKNMIAKCEDVNPQFNGGSATAQDYTFVFNGGHYKYTISNSCNIDAYVDIIVYTAKQPTNWTVNAAWDEDMSRDDTLTDTSGVYTQTTDEDQATLGNRPGKSGYLVNNYYRKRYVGRRVLKPGEQFTYAHKLMPWKWNTKSWYAHLTASNVSVNDLPNYFEKSQRIMFIVHGQNVHDLADGDVSPGNAQVNVTVSETFSWRAVPGTKKDQYISQNALPSIDAGAQRIIQDDGDIQAGTVNL